jgi:hypothetical protein
LRQFAGAGIESEMAGNGRKGNARPIGERNPDACQENTRQVRRMGWTYSTIPIRIDGENAHGYFRPMTAPLIDMMSVEELDPELEGLI